MGTIIVLTQSYHTMLVKSNPLNLMRENMISYTVVGWADQAGKIVLHWSEPYNCVILQLIQQIALQARAEPSENVN